jgi:hypothetical protein
MTLGSFQAARLGTIGVASGKWYWEIVYTAATAFDGMVGVADQSHNLNNYVGSSSVSWGYYYTGVKYNAASATSYGSSWTTGDVMSIALDMDNLAIYFAKNGVWQNSGVPTSGASKTGAAYTNLSGTIFPALNAYGGTQVVNFGQRPFAYTAPSGFKALNTANLPAPVVTKPSDVMDVKLYTGNGSTQTISGLGFSPDFVWIKNRAAADNHKLTDIVRGATEELESNTTDAEATNADGLTQFNADGFDLGDDDEYNTSSEAYVAWAWDAGTSTVTNTDGSISSQVRANASAGFSVVTYTGAGSVNATIGHGLGVAPQLIITKSRTGANNWITWHGTFGANEYIALNLTSTKNYAGTGDTTFGGTSASLPTSTVFTVGSDLNPSSAAFVAYCFAPVAGYSSAFLYTGNGSSDGPMVYLGFRPRLVLLKSSSGNENWILIDSARGVYNVIDKLLFPNTSGSEETYSQVDFLSNGFKIRNTGSGANANAGTYIGFAWAESPFQYARAR